MSKRKSRWQALQERRGFSESRKRGRAGNRKGRESEQRVWSALESAGTDAWPPWLVSARWSTPAEDKRGLDFVVQVDTGTVYLQVKSSHGAAEQFLKRHPAARSLPVAVVVVLKGTTTEGLRAQLLYKLSQLRERVAGDLDERHQRLTAAIAHGLREHINSNGDVTKETARGVAFDLARHLASWLERETGFTLADTPTE